MLKVVSWNMGFALRRKATDRAHAWDVLRQLQPDIALLQETVPDTQCTTPHTVHRAGGIGKSRPWGSAIVSFTMPVMEITHVQTRYSKRAIHLPRTYPGTVAIGQIGRLTVISFYGLIEDKYAITTVHRHLSDLTPLFDPPRRRTPLVILAGDLNLSTQFEEPARRRHRNAFERFASLGLVDYLALEQPARGPLAGCPCDDTPCQHVQTQWHRRSTQPKPWQTDYVFVSDALVSAVRTCKPVPWGQEQCSDHCPLVFDLDVTL